MSPREGTFYLRHTEVLMKDPETYICRYAVGKENCGWKHKLETYRHFDNGCCTLMRAAKEKSQQNRTQRSVYR